MAGDNPPRHGEDDPRAAGEKDSPKRRVLVRRLSAGLAGVGLAAMATGRAAAQNLVLPDGTSVGAFEVIQVATFAGVLGAAMLSAIWLIRERGRIAAENLDLRGRIAELNGHVKRNEALINLRDQRTIVWMPDAERPELIGSLGPAADAPEDRAGFMAFGRWLTSRSAGQLERAIGGLREQARHFDIVVETIGGNPLEVQGRRAGSTAVVRFLALTDRLRDHARLKVEHNQLVSDHSVILSLLNELPTPMWVRGQDGLLRWVNQAYAVAVDADSPKLAIDEAREFLGSQSLEQIAQHHLASPVFDRALATVIGGDRRVFSVIDVRTSEGAAGIAVDRSEIETVRAESERVLRSHSETLDQLNTAVAIFDADQKLRFFNQAFQKLWELDSAFLASAPDNTLLLDRLRSDGMLAEQPEWRRWKENLLLAYRSAESQEHWWHLPDGRTVRVVANPHPKGGVTWVFENLTERIDLETRYNSAVRVQGETLDNLAEGVAVFGPDGRIRLSNPAFAKLWRLNEGEAQSKTHIAAIRAAAERSCAASPWPDFVAAVTGFDDERRETHGQAELRDGTILSYAMIPLPNGQVMMTFVDVTDSVNFERALREKNDALERADQLKNDFVQHVSYELRSPLTNIIGFTELLSLPDTGPLTPRQRDYLDHIGSSSAVLLTIVNDILDLATVDAGIMELDIGEVSIDQVIRVSADLVAERLKEHSIELAIDVSDAPEGFRADENRLRQILFNLLSNAANYAPEGSVVRLSCRRAGDAVEFSVHDSGPGMPPEILDIVFKRFEPRVNGGRRRGAGLGLAIVKSFVELHGGQVGIETGHGQGTRVICRFPLTPLSRQAAAE